MLGDDEESGVLSLQAKAETRQNEKLSAFSYTLPNLLMRCPSLGKAAIRV